MDKLLHHNIPSGAGFRPPTVEILATIVVDIISYQGSSPFSLNGMDKEGTWVFGQVRK